MKYEIGKIYKVMFGRSLYQVSDFNIVTMKTDEIVLIIDEDENHYRLLHNNKTLSLTKDFIKSFGLKEII